MSVILSENGGIFFITLVAGARGNRLSNASAVKIAEIIEKIASGRLVVIASEGPDFCVGRDFGGAADKWSDQSALEVRAGNTEPVLRLLGAVRRCSVPVMTVIRGKAMGVGVSLAAVSDLAIASEDSSFQLPEMDHGIPPCLVMSALIGRVAPNAITQMIYSTESVGAFRARDLGIITDVVPASDLPARVDSLVSRIASQPIAAVRAVKEYMRSAPRMDSQAASDFASTLLSGVLSSPPMSPN